VAQVLVHQLVATQPFALRLRLLANLRHMSALNRKRLVFPSGACSDAGLTMS
jgi:hypothetical protein